MTNHVEYKYCTCNGAGTCTGCCLFICKVCKGAEASLATECPGRKITPEEDELIQNGKIDFVNGSWIEIDTPERSEDTK